MIGFTKSHKHGARNEVENHARDWPDSGLDFSRKGAAAARRTGRTCAKTGRKMAHFTGTHRVRPNALFFGAPRPKFTPPRCAPGGFVKPPFSAAAPDEPVADSNAVRFERVTEPPTTDAQRNPVTRVTWKYFDQCDRLIRVVHPDPDGGEALTFASDCVSYCADGSIRATWVEHGTCSRSSTTATQATAPTVFIGVPPIGRGASAATGRMKRDRVSLFKPPGRLGAGRPRLRREDRRLSCWGVDVVGVWILSTDCRRRDVRAARSGLDT